jgi:hypothetical protein
VTTTEVAGVSPEEYIALDNELKQNMRDQASGKWEKQANETQEQCDARVQKIVRRCVELTSILRRSNTGPAAPKKRGARAAKQLDEKALQSLLD